MHLSQRRFMEAQKFPSEKSTVLIFCDCGVCWLPWAQTVKRLPARQETRVRSLGQEDPLEEEMATHSSTLTWKIPWTEGPGKLQFMDSQRVGHDWATSLSLAWCVLSRFSCVWLCNPMNCIPPGSSVHGILQARKQEWVAMPFSRGSSQPRDGTCVSYISFVGKGIFLLLVPSGKPQWDQISSSSTWLSISGWCLTDTV